MKVLQKSVVALLLAFVAVGFFSACQDEDEMEDKILTGVCWEGKLPIRENYGQEKYFSRFYFYDDNYKTGYEEIYYRGEYQETMEFDWYWLDRSGAYGVMALNYGGRWQSDIICIDITKVTNNYIYGYYYTSLAEYEAYKESGSSSRSGTYFELKHVDVTPHHDRNMDPDTNTDENQNQGRGRGESQDQGEGQNQDSEQTQGAE